MIRARGHEGEREGDLQHVLEPGEAQRRERRRHQRGDERDPRDLLPHGAAAQRAIGDDHGRDAEERGEQQRRLVPRPEHPDPRRQQHGPERRRRARREVIRGDAPSVPLREVPGHRKVDVGVVERVAERALIEPRRDDPQSRQQHQEQGERDDQHPVPAARHRASAGAGDDGSSRWCDRSPSPPPACRRSRWSNPRR